MDLDRLTIATFNLLNLNLPGLRMYRDADGWTQAQYDRKLEWTEWVLRRTPADVWGLQELWHRDAIAAALDMGGLGADFDILTPPGDADGRRIVCAALVRKGLLEGEPEWIADFPPGLILQSQGDDHQTPQIGVNITGFSRPVLHFTIRPRATGGPVHVYVCHFKSKGATEIDAEPWFNAADHARHRKSLGAALSTIRRTAEAAALRVILTDRMKDTDTPVIVLGDINDGQHSNTANILTEQPAYLVGGRLGGRDNALYTAQTLQEYRSTRDVYYTHIYEDIMESLDHILVSEQFYENSRKRKWLFGGLTVANDHLSFADHKTSGTNDHGIVHAVFDWKPAKPAADPVA